MKSVETINYQGAIQINPKRFPKDEMILLYTYTYVCQMIRTRPRQEIALLDFVLVKIKSSHFCFSVAVTYFLFSWFMDPVPS